MKFKVFIVLLWTFGFVSILYSDGGASFALRNKENFDEQTQMERWMWDDVRAIPHFMM